ncbi:MAG: FtsX-like permease family protein [Polyangiales bacterium]
MNLHRSSLLGLGDAVTGVEVAVDKIDDAGNIAERIESTIAEGSLKANDWQSLNEHLFGALALEKLAMFITLGIAIVVAGFSVFGTLTLLIQEKTREVGMLKALGLRATRIVQIFLWEGFLIGLGGAIVGLGTGYVISFGAKHFGIRLNSEVYYIDKLPVQIDPTEFAMVGIATVVVCVCATVIPARTASRVPPIEALKND